MRCLAGRAVMARNGRERAGDNLEMVREGTEKEGMTRKGTERKENYTEDTRKRNGNYTEDTRKRNGNYTERHGRPPLWWSS